MGGGGFEPSNPPLPMPLHPGVTGFSPFLLLIKQQLKTMAPTHEETSSLSWVPDKEVCEKNDAVRRQQKHDVYHQHVTHDFRSTSVEEEA